MSKLFERLRNAARSRAEAQAPQFPDVGSLLTQALRRAEAEREKARAQVGSEHEAEAQALEKARNDQDAVSELVQRIEAGQMIVAQTRARIAAEEEARAAAEQRAEAEALAARLLEERIATERQAGEAMIARARAERRALVAERERAEIERRAEEAAMARAAAEMHALAPPSEPYSAQPKPDQPPSSFSLSRAFAFLIAVVLIALLWQFAPWRAPERAPGKVDPGLRLDQQLDLKRPKG